MDKKEDFLQSVPCYKLNCDLSSVDISDVFDLLSKYGDILFSEGYFYIWIDPEYTKKNVISRLKRLGVTEVYCEHIIFNLDDDSKQELNHLIAWWAEHFFTMYNNYIEKNYQDYLKTLNNTINVTKEMIKNNQSESALDK